MSGPSGRYNPNSMQRMLQSQQAHMSNMQKVSMHSVAPGQRLRLATPRPLPMATAFMDSTACTDTTTCTADYITIHNDGGTTATIGTTQTGTASGNTLYIVDTGGNWHASQQAPPAPHQHAPQVQYDPRILNRYLSASDLLEEFIKDLGDLDVKQGDVLNVPIELFINWLICKAAEEDGHAPPDDIARLPAPGDIRGLPDRRCQCCGRYITEVRRRAGVLFCDGEHQELWLARLTGGGVPQNRRAIKRDHRNQRRHDHVQVVPRRQLAALAGVG